MLVQILVGVGLLLLVILCLPFAAIQKLVLEVYAFALRLALLALLGVGAFLWFYPDRLPTEVTEPLANFPALGKLLPEPGTPPFGACVAGLIVVMLLPILAVLDVTRKLAGRRLSRLRALSAGPVVETPPSPPSEQTIEEPSPPAEAQTVEEPPPPPPVQEGVISVPRRTDRRVAADTLAAAGSRKPFRYTGPERGSDLPPGTS